MSIVIENLSYVYSPKTPFEHKALDNISLTVEDGDFLGIIGATGSGKSPFIQHLNGLIKLTSGKITVDGIELHNKPDLKKLRAEVGMVFQYPEYQLFDETVEKDVSFGPKNLGLKKDEIAERVKEAVETVGLDYEQFKERSPFELSGDKTAASQSPALSQCARKSLFWTSLRQGSIPSAASKCSTLSRN